MMRLFGRVPLPPFCVGLGLGLGTYLVYLAYTLAFGPRFGELAGTAGDNLWAAELIVCLLIGFAPTVTAYTMRGSLRDLADLRPVLSCSDAEYARLGREITAYRAWPLRLWGWVFALGTVVVVGSDPQLWSEGILPPLGDPSLTWLVGRNALNSWMVGRAMVLEISFARAFSRVGEHLGPINLLDPASLAPFGRRGLRSVLLWMLFVAFYSLLYTGGWAVDILAGVLVAIVAWGFIGFLLPVLGAHRRIREAKDGELSQVRAAIHEVRGRAIPLEADPASLGGGRLADLVAYEARISSVREWPFDAPTVLRWVLFVALGAASWLGGAFVERALGLALD